MLVVCCYTVEKRKELDISTLLDKIHTKCRGLSTKAHDFRTLYTGCLLIKNTSVAQSTVRWSFNKDKDYAIPLQFIEIASSNYRLRIYFIHFTMLCLLLIVLESVQVKQNVKTVQTMQMRNEVTNYASNW